MVNTAERHSCQVVAHCIGDGAVELMLDIYDSVISENRNRHGIVHCQLTDRVLLERMKNRDILVFVQPVFIDYDMDIVSTSVGERLASESHAFGDMVRMGIRTSYGTDAPVEDMNPFENIYTAVTRRKIDGSAEYRPDQKVNIYEALDCYTTQGAYASFAENRRGMLLPSFDADFAVLDRDIFTCSPKEIKNTRVLKTVLAGEEIYSVL